MPSEPEVKPPSWRLRVLKAAIRVWPIVEPYLLKWLQSRAAKP